MPKYKLDNIQFCCSICNFWVRALVKFETCRVPHRKTAQVNHTNTIIILFDTDVHNIPVALGQLTLKKWWFPHNILSAWPSLTRETTGVPLTKHRAAPRGSICRPPPSTRSRQCSGWIPRPDSWMSAELDPPTSVRSWKWQENLIFIIERLLKNKRKAFPKRKAQSPCLVWLGNCN